MNLKNEKFAQANELIKATHKMNNRELKTFFYACTIRDENEEVITVPYADLCEKLEVQKGGKQKELFERAWENIMSKDIIKIEPENSRTGKKIMGHLLSSIRWNTNNVDIVFNRDFLPLLDNLKKDHTWMYLEQLAKLDKEYSPRFYEFFKMTLMQNKHINFRWYLDTRSDKSIGLKEFLGIEDKKAYKRFNNLRQRIIEPCIAEINEKSNDISVGYDIYYKGRSAIALDLRIYAASTLPIYDPMSPNYGKWVENEENGVPGGQTNIYDYPEMENPRSRPGNKRSQLVGLRPDLVKFDSRILYDWLDEEERQKRR